MRLVPQQNNKSNRNMKNLKKSYNGAILIIEENCNKSLLPIIRPLFLLSYQFIGHYTTLFFLLFQKQTPYLTASVENLAYL